VYIKKANSQPALLVADDLDVAFDCSGAEILFLTFVEAVVAGGSSFEGWVNVRLTRCLSVEAEPESTLAELDNSGFFSVESDFVKSRVRRLNVYCADL
jgi:hypothetical protein